MTGVETRARVEPMSVHRAWPVPGMGGWQVLVTPVWLQGLEGGPFPIAPRLLPPAGARRGRGANPLGRWRKAGNGAHWIGRGRRAPSPMSSFTPSRCSPVAGRQGAPRAHREVKATQGDWGLPRANLGFTGSLEDPQA